MEPLQRSIFGQSQWGNNISLLFIKKLNAEHKAKYAEAVSLILDDLQQNGIDCDAINIEVEKVYEEIKTLDIKCKRSPVRPPR